MATSTATEPESGDAGIHVKLDSGQTEPLDTARLRRELERWIEGPRHIRIRSNLGPLTEAYSLYADFDDRWRTGGSVEEVIAEEMPAVEAACAAASASLASFSAAS